jgi:hypothetical protein
VKINTRQGETKAYNRCKRNPTEYAAVIEAAELTLEHFDNTYWADDWSRWPRLLEDIAFDADTARWNSSHESAIRLRELAEGFRV